MRGIVLLGTSIDEGRELMAPDPKVRAGLFEVRLATWIFPAGAVTFAPAEIPRSMAEAAARLGG